MDKEHVQRRVRLNSLALACADVSILSFADAARKLGIEEDAVELWVIDGWCSVGLGPSLYPCLSCPPFLGAGPCTI